LPSFLTWLSRFSFDRIAEQKYQSNVLLKKKALKFYKLSFELHRISQMLTRLCETCTAVAEEANAHKSRCKPNSPTEED
jgi:hypothetical protein